MGLACISYCDYFKITLTTDDTIMRDPQVLLDLIELNIRKCYVQQHTPIADEGPVEESIEEQ